MKRIGKIFVILLIVIILILIGMQMWNYLNNSKAQISKDAIDYSYTLAENTAEENKYGSVTKKLIVVKVEENDLKTMDYNETLDIVSVKNEVMSKFKQGQEILVYYDGLIATSYPGRINADKIEILNEESEIEIPIEILRYYNFSQNNISVKIENISNTKIEFSISDLNEIPLDYGDHYEYCIFKKNFENEIYNQNLEVDENEITPAVATDTYSTTSSYNPGTVKIKQVWEELELIGNENYKNCEWDVISESGMIFIGNTDWTDLYGELSTGEYQFKVYRKPTEEGSLDNLFFNSISIKFIVDDSGNVSYENPEFVW